MMSSSITTLEVPNGQVLAITHSEIGVHGQLHRIIRT